MNARVDHLVIVADNLEQGAQWCEATLGAQPVTGGRHALMGTHNRLLAIGSERFPDSYLEIIAIDPEAPRLVHAVARTTLIEMVRWGLVNCGLNPGDLVAAQRDTPAGLLKWRITVRDDGAMACGGALPTLIEWQGAHPCQRLPPSTVALRALTLRGLPAQAVGVLKLPAVQSTGRVPREPALSATFDTSRGAVMLDAWT